MSEWWQFGLLVAAYFLLVKVVFPKLGIQG